MVKYVRTNAIQATRALGLVQAHVTMVSGHKVDFTARVNFRQGFVIAKCWLRQHSKAQTEKDETENMLLQVLSD